MSDGVDFLDELYRRTKGSHWANSKGWDRVRVPEEGVPDVHGTPAHLYLCYGTTFDKEVLTKLILLENGLAGTLPPTLASSLSFINLAANELIGEIPAAIGALLSLEYLSFFGNKLTGRIPPEIGRCKSLKSLFLHANRLEGSVPSCLEHLPLVNLNLSHNNLNHAEFIPEFLTHIPTLKLLNLSASYICRINRQQSGAPVRNPINKFVSTAHHQLRRGVPRDIGVGLTSLTALQCSNTNMDGIFPESLCLIRTIKILRLSFNNLTGEIPDAIGDLVRLTTLDLESNALTGKLPDTVSSLKSLNILKLRFNQLTGEPPAESLARCKGLRTLDLRQNDFTLPEGKNLWSDNPAKVLELLQSGKSTFNGQLEVARAAAQAAAAATTLQAKQSLPDEAAWLLQRGCRPEEVERLCAKDGESDARSSERARRSPATKKGFPRAKGFPAVVNHSLGHSLSLPTISTSLRPLRSPLNAKSNTQYRTNVDRETAASGAASFGVEEGVFSLDSGAFVASTMDSPSGVQDLQVVAEPNHTSKVKMSASSLVQSIRATAEANRAGRWEEHERLVGACLDVVNPAPRVQSGFHAKLVEDRDKLLEATQLTRQMEATAGIRGIQQMEARTGLRGKRK
jgi:hypothetical protein